MFPLLQVVYVLGSATIGDVIKTLHEHGVHRVYICESHQHKKPIGAIAIQGQQTTLGTRDTGRRSSSLTPLCSPCLITDILREIISAGGS